ncbi:NAD-dependent epimerase/dehydratase family protein [Methylobacterium nodulans]|uniref:NAD-dependent epimerase/dehydratase n=1 Tax=Methylobacterium nodulans (strain LMG 21967 / CNCM I-2342 / ORS 2060) TaxID=460265 RepID=B8IH42_METNO|nr:NAD-dependent epimerase/dehydratase family protein [Methylobacterium nodulans]ACL59734.1 NAD-dependent epimerase/dehydratase [Methylobacterium nodulans ORS 2060]
MTSIDLVTGGCGFIGRHLVERLLAAGRAVRVLDCGDPRGLPASVDYRRGSILDETCLSAAMRGIDRIYHLAGIAHLWAADRDAFARVNALGTERVVAAAPDASRVVHCSTEAVLLTDSREDGPVRGDDLPPLERMSGPYTRSKCLAERAALAAAQAGRSIVIASPTVPIGPCDWNMTPPAAMLSLFLSGQAPVFLDCTLNLVDVRDVAEGIRLAGEHGRPGQRYVLGGENVRLRLLLSRLERLSGRPMPSFALPGGVAMMLATVSEWIADHLSRNSPPATREGVRLALRSAPIDDGKARTELGYRSRPIDEALSLAVAWLTGGTAQRPDPILVGRKTGSAS